MEGDVKVVGEKAPDFELADSQGGMLKLYEVLRTSPVILVFYPGDFTPVCTKQLCNYRDDVSGFQQAGVRILGISRNSSEEHQRFATQFHLPFTLLTDPGHRVAKAFRCTSPLMLGQVSRAVVIVNTKGFILYRKVEPTPITRRKSQQLMEVLADLKKHGLLN